MKTPEELNTLKEEFEALQKKLSELTAEEIDLVTGGDGVIFLPKTGGHVPGQKKRG
ncbi:MAG: hypothetical protein Q4F31_10110 [Eubacteriales bacterium]|nr:hypothetical protein [Eubacteriales bacterium]